MSEEKNEKLKIAIIEGDYGYDRYDSDVYIISRITEWTEVTQEEYGLLKAYQFHSNPNYYIILQKPVGPILDRAVDWYKSEAEKRHKAEQKRLEKDAARRAQMAQRTADAAKRKLMRLAEKAGMAVVPKTD